MYIYKYSRFWKFASPPRPFSDEKPARVKSTSTLSTRLHPRTRQNSWKKKERKKRKKKRTEKMKKKKQKKKEKRGKKMERDEYVPSSVSSFTSVISISVNGRTIEYWVPIFARFLARAFIPCRKCFFFSLLFFFLWRKEKRREEHN